MWKFIFENRIVHMRKMKVKVAQACSTLCDLMGYTVWILQAGILKWVVFPFSRGSSQFRAQTQVSHVAGRFFTSWATRESPTHPLWYSNWHLVITQDSWSRKWQPTPVFLPGKFPRTEEPGRLQFMGLQRVRHNWRTKHHLSRYAGLYYWAGLQILGREPQWIS